jgi:predicted transposase YdaD
VAALLGDEPPELLPGSFVSKRLRGHRTDRLYRTRTRAGRPALVYTLIEHKSAPDPRLPLQLLGYQYQVLEHWDRTEGRAPDGTPRPLPALVTLVVYHGSRPWTVPASLGAATDADEGLRPYCLDFRYSLADLGRIPDAQLSQDRRLRVGLLILKHGAVGRADRRRLLKIARQALRLGHDDLATFLYYLLADLTDDPRGELARDILRELVPEEEERMVSQIAEEWMAEGEAKGFNQGLQKGKAEGETSGKADMLLRLLKRRFGPLPPETEARVRAAGPDRLDLWGERILDATDPAEVMRDD